MMTDARVMSIDELKAFLASSYVFTFKGNSQEEIYAWIERTFVATATAFAPDHRKE